MGCLKMPHLQTGVFQTVITVASQPNVPRKFISSEPDELDFLFCLDAVLRNSESFKRVLYFPSNRREKCLHLLSDPPQFV